MVHPSGPLTEKHDRDLVPPATRNGHIQPVSKHGIHLSTGVEASDIDGDGRPIPRWKLWYAKGMLVWSVASHSFLLIQAIKIYGEKNANGVSLPAYIVYLFGAVVWFVYGMFVLERKNLAIILSAVTAFLLGTVVLIGIILYGNAPKDCSEEIAVALGDVSRLRTEKLSNV